MPHIVLLPTLIFAGPKDGKTHYCERTWSRIETFLVSLSCAGLSWFGPDLASVPAVIGHTGTLAAFGVGAVLLARPINLEIDHKTCGLRLLRGARRLLGHPLSIGRDAMSHLLIEPETMQWRLSADFRARLVLVYRNGKRLDIDRYLNEQQVNQLGSTLSAALDLRVINSDLAV